MIFTTGDIHGPMDIKKLNSERWPEGKNLTKSDYLIILGDFGLIFMPSFTAEEKYWFDWLNDKPWTTLFLAGNHENFDRLLSYPKENYMGGLASRVSDSIWYLRNGEIYTVDGKTFFCFGGGVSIDKAYRIEKLTWWEQEIPTQEEFENGINNLEKYDFVVDYVISHSCPSHVFNKLPLYPKYKDNDIVCQMLEEFDNITKFKHWYFGHYHINELNMKIDGDNYSTLYDKIIEIK